MLIRSQDKKYLIDFSNMAVSINNKVVGQIIAYNTGLFDEGYFTIGDYSTEEKAIKVLDMIQNAYYGFEETKLFAKDKGEMESPIFIMPTDEEVN